MKIIIWLMAFLSVQVNAQIGPLHFQETNQDFEGLLMVEEISDTSLLLVSDTYVEEESTNAMRLRIVSKDGVVIRNKLFVIDSITFSVEYMLMGKDSSYFIVIGRAGSFNRQTEVKFERFYHIALRVNMDLELESYDLYHRSDSLISVGYSARWVNDSLIVGLSQLRNRNFRAKANSIFFVDSEAIFKKEVRIYSMDEFKGELILDIIPKKNGKGYYSFGRDVRSLDENFNLIEVLIENDKNSFGQGHIVSLNSGSEFIYAQSIGGDGIGLAKYDSSFNILKESTEIEGANGELSFAGGGRCIDYKYEDKIYVGGIYIQDPAHYYPIIAQLDNKMHLRWIKYYSPMIREEEYYSVYDILASNEGGCYCGGSLTTKVDGGWLGYSFLLHVNEKGEIVSTKDTPKMKIDLTVYPNPSQGEFRMNLKGELRQGKIIFVDMLGKEVIKESFRSGENVYNFPTLKSGLYNYVLYDYEGQIIGQGKWVKK